LFIKGWTVTDCIDHFERLARLAFEKCRFHIPLLSDILAFLTSLATDRRYSASNLEHALQEFFDRDRSILDYSSATASGTKVGVVVSSIEPRPFVFTNYNGLGERNLETAEYGVLHGSIPLWEI
jgi:hypothetical protein